MTTSSGQYERNRCDDHGAQHVRPRPGSLARRIVARVVDEMHIAIAPVLLGGGERLFGHVDLGAYACTPLTCSAGIAHLHVVRTGQRGT